MSKTDLIFYIFKKYPPQLTKTEKKLLEIKLFTHFYYELSKIYYARYQDYQKLIKSTQGEPMFGIQFMKELINDILLTEKYSLSGIAHYTRIPEDVLYDIAAGINTNPTFDFSRKLFELHLTVKP